MPVRTIGSSSELLEIISDPPSGSEELLMQVLQIWMYFSHGYLGESILYVNPLFYLDAGFTYIDRWDYTFS